MKNLQGLLIVALLVGAAGPVSPIAQADEREPVSQRLGDDTFMAGSKVRLAGEAPGDAVLAGGNVATAVAVQGDMVVAGGELTLQAPVAGDLYAAGGKVRLDGKVSGNARMAGGQVAIGPDGEVQGGTSIAGGEITIDGRVGRYLQVAAGSTRLNGHVGGDVRVSGGELNIGPEAAIDGSVIFRGPKPATVAPGAQIKGDVRHIPQQRRGGAMQAVFGAGAILWLLGWIVVGCLLLALWPRFSRTVTQTAARRPWISLLAGFIAMVVTPVAIVLLMISLIGIPLGLLALALYLVLMPLGLLAAAMAMGDALLPRFRKSGEILARHRMVAFLAAAVVLFLIVQIPFLGALIAALAVAVGMGGLLLAAVAGHRAPPSIAAA